MNLTNININANQVILQLILIATIIIICAYILPMGKTMILLHKKETLKAKEMKKKGKLTS